MDNKYRIKEIVLKNYSKFEPEIYLPNFQFKDVIIDGWVKVWYVLCIGRMDNLTFDGAMKLINDHKNLKPIYKSNIIIHEIE